MSLTDSLDVLDERITAYPWPLGILAGVWAFITGYVMMAVVVLSTAEFPPNAPLEYQAKIVGFIYYNAHYIPLEVDSPIRLAGSATQNFLTQGGLSLPVFVYYAIPVVAIVGAGGLLANRRPEDATLSEYALPGLAITLGYLVTAVAARFVIQRSVEISGQAAATVAPSFQLTLLYALLFPLLLAGTASLLIGVLRNQAQVRRSLPR